MIPPVLTIAGSDPSGGAGVQADMKTFTSHRCYGMGVITALTVQNIHGVSSIHAVAPDIIRDQIEALLSSMRVDRIKIGMLATPQAVHVVAECLKSYPHIPVLLDPILAPSFYQQERRDQERQLLADAIRIDLIPLVDLVTPNIPEALALLDDYDLIPPTTQDEMNRLARTICDLGPKAVLLKGGHMTASDISQDCLVMRDAETPLFLSSPRVATHHTHGTGCALSAAILSYQALGLSLPEAVTRAKDYIQGGLSHRAQLPFSDQETYGPFNHLWRD